MSSEIIDLKKRYKIFRKYTLSLKALEHLPGECYEVLDDRVYSDYRIFFVDLRPDMPPVGRSDVAYIVYRRGKPVYQRVGKSPADKEQAILAVKRIEERDAEEILLEVLGLV